MDCQRSAILVLDKKAQQYGQACLIFLINEVWMLELQLVLLAYYCSTHIEEGGGGDGHLQMWAGVGDNIKIHL